MKYHKKLTRKDLLKYGWKKLLMMTASEFSRANSLANNGGGKELKHCLLRAKEIFSVLETDPSIPSQTGLKLIPIARSLIDLAKSKSGYLYTKAMDIAS